MVSEVDEVLSVFGFVCLSNSSRCASVPPVSLSSTATSALSEKKKKIKNQNQPLKARLPLLFFSKISKSLPFIFIFSLPSPAATHRNQKHRQRGDTTVVEEFVPGATHQLRPLPPFSSLSGPTQASDRRAVPPKETDKHDILTGDRDLRERSKGQEEPIVVIIAISKGRRWVWVGDGQVDDDNDAVLQLGGAEEQQ